MPERRSPIRGQQAPSTPGSRRTPFDEDRLRIGDEHGRRQQRRLAEAELVRAGLMTRTWKDWGFPNGYDDALIPMLLEALQRRTAGTALVIGEWKGFSGKRHRHYSKRMDKLVAQTGLAADRLADDLVRDIERWREDAEILRHASEVRRAGGHPETCAPIQEAVVSAATGSAAVVPVASRPSGASEAQINRTITAVYDYAESEHMKPPNVKEIAPHVLTRLQREGWTATQAHIAQLAGGEPHRLRRLPAGPRVNRSFLPFLDLEM
jgi:hypothetical protein